MKFLRLSSTIAAAVLIMCLAQLAVRCTKDKTPRPAEPCDPNQIYFEKSIKPLINSNCTMSGCHNANDAADGVDLSTYEGIRKQVRPGRPQDSDLIEAINEDDSDKRMPLGRAPLTAAQKKLLWDWVQQGAENVICNNGASCSPSNVSFVTDIQPVLSGNCMGCHSGSGSSGGVDLSAYTGVQTVAKSGKLYNAVAQNGLATPMPQGGKLSGCDIQKIKTWVDEGAKNN